MSLLDTASLIVTPNGYKESKLYSVIPSDGSGDLSVVRATTATRVNSAGLVELVPYNLVRYSEQFNNAAWVQNAAITANTAISPDGTQNADTILGSGFVGQTILQSGIHTFSVFAKAGTSNEIRLNVFDGTNNRGVRYDLLNGIITSSYGTIIASNIISFGNGWFRISITTNNATNSNVQIHRDSAQTVFIWGAQLVEGSTAKDYQKTETRLNIPRLDYSNGTCPSLLVEPQRTNLAIWSSSFDNAAWIKGNSSITANATDSPSGIQDADRLVENTANSTHAFNNSVGLTSSAGILTASIYFKNNTRNFAWIQIATDNAAKRYTVVCDLVNGTITSTTTVGSPTSISNSITNVGNGWYRISVSSQHNSGSVFLVSGLSNSATPTYDANGYPTYLGNGTSSIYVWGAQVELGNYASSYIPTTSASVTRNADVISKTGISSLIGTEFTLFYDGYETIGGTSTRYIILKGSGGTYANSVFIEGSSNRIRLTILNNSSGTIFTALSDLLTNGQRFKLAVRCKNNDFAFYLNGNLVASQASGSVPTTSDLYLGYYTDYSDNYSQVNAAAIWPTALTDDQLTALTTL